MEHLVKYFLLIKTAHVFAILLKFIFDWKIFLIFSAVFSGK